MLKHKLALACVASCAVLASGITCAKDGVYRTTSQGRNGEVAVEVTITKGKIADIKVFDKEWSETHPIADLPKVQIPKQIIKHQSIEVDVVTGATLTSRAILDCVEKAIEAAGLNVDKFSKPIPQPKTLTGTVTQTAPVVIIGGGGAGLSAAVAASKAGQKVIVIEKAHCVGGNTSVAGGNYNTYDPKRIEKFKMTPDRRKIIDSILSEPPRNDLHKALQAKVKKQFEEYLASGIERLFDSPEFHALQTWKGGDYKADLHLVDKLTQRAPGFEKELENMGIVWRKYSEQPMGALWPRSQRAANYASGVGFIDTFLGEIDKKKLPVKIITNMRATDLIMKNGRVVGVKAQSRLRHDKRTHIFKATKGVILASGGFGANVEMRNKYDELWGKKLGPDLNTTNVKTNEGDGIVMAEKIGAELVQMGYIQLLPTTDPYTGSSSSKASISTSMFVNKNGERFVNETGRRDEISRAALAQPGQRFFLISTGDVWQINKQGRNKYGVKLTDLVAQKKVFLGNTWDELAQKAGINAENLKKSVANWIEFCKNPKNDKFGRPSCDPEVRLDGKPPYVATIMSPSVHHTMGGVKINDQAQVINKQGKVIPGLWAAGEVTGGIHGTNRVGGNAIPDVLTTGKLAGENVAKAKK